MKCEVMMSSVQSNLSFHWARVHVPLSLPCADLHYYVEDIKQLCVCAPPRQYNEQLDKQSSRVVSYDRTHYERA